MIFIKLYTEQMRRGRDYFLVQRQVKSYIWRNQEYKETK